MYVPAALLMASQNWEHIWAVSLCQLLLSSWQRHSCNVALSFSLSFHHIFSRGKGDEDFLDLDIRDVARGLSTTTWRSLWVINGTQVCALRLIAACFSHGKWSSVAAHAGHFHVRRDVSFGGLCYKTALTTDNAVASSSNRRLMLTSLWPTHQLFPQSSRPSVNGCQSGSQAWSLVLKIPLWRKTKFQHKYSASRAGCQIDRGAVLGHAVRRSYTAIYIALERSRFVDEKPLQKPVWRWSGNCGLFAGKNIPRYSERGEIVGTIVGASGRDARNIRCLKCQEGWKIDLFKHTENRRVKVVNVRILLVNVDAIEIIIVDQVGNIGCQSWCPHEKKLEKFSSWWENSNCRWTGCALRLRSVWTCWTRRLSWQWESGPHKMRRGHRRRNRRVCKRKYRAERFLGRGKTSQL